MKLRFTFEPERGLAYPYEASVPDEEMLKPFLTGEFRFAIADEYGNVGDPYVPDSYEYLLSWIEDELAGFTWGSHGPWRAYLRIYDEQDELVQGVEIEVEPDWVEQDVEIEVGETKRQGRVEFLPGEWLGVGFLYGDSLEEGYDVLLEENDFSGYFRRDSINRLSLERAAEIVAEEVLERLAQGETLRPAVVFFRREDIPGHYRPVTIAGQIDLEPLTA